MSSPVGDRFLSRDVDWDAVYTELLPRIYNYFRFRIRNPSDAEELTSRTFEKAWRAREQYKRDRAGFSAWLYSIARNVAIDHVRAQRVEVVIDSVDDLATAGTPETDVARESDMARLAALTADLPERERELIALKYGAGLTNRAIAGYTGLTESNVGTILHRTVEALRSRW